MVRSSSVLAAATALFRRGDREGPFYKPHILVERMCFEI
jgi:hypothetical protein